MKSRYGIDELDNFMFKIYLILFIINIFFKSSLISFIELLLVIVIFYRFLSKNINARRKENMWFLNLKNKSVYKEDYILKNVLNVKNFLNYQYHIKKVLKALYVQNVIKNLEC